VSDATQQFGVFLPMCVAFVVVRALSEFAKLVLVILACVRGSIVNHSSKFISSSFLCPLLYCSKVDFAHAMIMHESAGCDWVVCFVTDGLLYAFPQLALSLHYALSVEKTGLALTGVFSIGSTIASAAYWIYCGCSSFCCQRADKPTGPPLPSTSNVRLLSLSEQESDTPLRTAKTTQ
jgi:hypothetical protein